MVILSLPLPNTTVQIFSGAKDLSLSRFLLMIVTPCCNVNMVKAMSKGTFLTLIIISRCKYT